MPRLSGNKNWRFQNFKQQQLGDDHQRNPAKMSKSTKSAWVKFQGWNEKFQSFFDTFDTLPVSRSQLPYIVVGFLRFLEGNECQPVSIHPMPQGAREANKHGKSPIATVGQDCR